jgi:multiple sugar transport system permease protein
MTQTIQDPVPSQEIPPPVPAGERRLDLRDGQASTALSNVLLGVLGVLFLLPMMWLVLGSLDSRASWGIEIPHFTLHNFREALASGGLRSLWNSLVLSVTATVVSTVTAALAGYTLVRRRIPWKGPILLIVLFMSGIPISIIIVPIYQIYVTLGWLSILPSALFLAVTSLPFEIWLMKNYIEALPPDLEESASIERASTYRILRHIVLPLTLPGLAACAIFGFINAWGSFVVPLVLISAAGQQTGPITIFGFIGAADVRYGDIAAFSLMYSVPIFVLYAAMSRLFRGGFVLGGAVRG